MRKRILAFAGVMTLAALASAPSALAHPGHHSCAPAAHAYVPPDEPGDMGELASTIAQSGNFHEFATAFHATLCKPAP